MTNTRDVITGELFKKYGRRGKPHARYVWISEREDFFYWKNPDKPSNVKSIRFYEVKDILVGYNSTAVLRQHKVSPDLDNRIFSIITNRRTLDLEAKDPEIRSRWEEYFRFMLIQRKEQNEELVHKMKDSRIKDRESISEIWKTDILPNFHQYWDYESHRPKGAQDTLSKKSKRGESPRDLTSPSRNKRGSFFSFLLCRRDDSPSPMKISKRKSEKTGVEEIDREEEAIRNMCKNKTLLLFHVWKLGIPDWLRKTIWPITIGNRLEITPTLYQLLLSQAKGYLKESTKNNSSITGSLKLMQKDLVTTFPHVEFFQNDEHKEVNRTISHRI